MVRCCPYLHDYERCNGPWPEWILGGLSIRSAQLHLPLNCIRWPHESAGLSVVRSTL